MAGTAEITRLEDLPDLDFSPPCEVDVQILGHTELCGKPAAARVRFECPCGFKRTAFICERCLEGLISRKNFVCKECYTASYTYRET